MHIFFDQELTRGGARRLKPSWRQLGAWHVREIGADPALMWYGAALSGVNALTAIYWFGEGRLAQILGDNAHHICWPLFDTCGGLGHLHAASVQCMLVLLLTASIANAYLFATGHPRSACFLLAILTGVKTALVLQDYRLILNQHYMALWATAVFLLSQRRRKALRWLLVSFYFWSGTLKLNGAWLSGAALYGLRPFDMPPGLVPLACAYVVVLELVGAYGLISQQRTVWSVSLGQLLLFHLSSFWIVGYFYPLLMFLLLSIVPLTRAGWPDRESSNVAPTIKTSYKARWHTSAVVIVFALCQLIPYLFPGPTAVTGEGRVFALHMFDAPLECHASARFTRGVKAGTTMVLRPEYVTARISCDPIVYVGLARNYCNRLSGGGDFDLLLETRRYNSHTFEPVVSVPSFCASGVHYSVWRHNPWIVASDYR